MTLKLFASMGLTICAFVFLLMIFIVFMAKKNAKEYDNKVFIFMMIITFLILINEVTYIYAMYAELDAHIPFIPTTIVCYSYIYLCIIWFMGLIVYIISKIKSDKMLEILRKTRLIRTIMLMGIAIILFVIAGMQQIEYPAGNSHLYVFAGPAVYVLYIVAIISLSVVWIGVFVRRKYIPDYQKYPIYFCLSMLVTINALQISLDYDWNSLSFLLSFVIITLYFTIESQDYRLINELKKKSEEAEIANQAKTQFLSNMSHEIRTPLNTILDFSHILLYEDSIKEEQIKNEGKMIYTASEELHEIINNILDISSIESNKIKIQNEEYDMNNLIYLIDESIHKKLTNDKLNFKIEVSPEILQKYNGDTQKISKMVVYVIDSIIQNTEYGMISLNVKGKQIEDHTEEISFDIISHANKMSKEEFQILFNNFKDYDIKSEKRLNYVSLELIVAREYLDILEGNYNIIENEHETHYLLTINQTIKQ